VSIFIIQTGQGDGRVLDVREAKSVGDAINFIVESARDEEYFTNGVTEAGLRAELLKDRSYVDCGIRTTIVDTSSIKTTDDPVDEED
jgi:hypothetical protein